MFHINLWVHSCPHLSKVGDQRWNLTSCCKIVPGRYTGEKNTHAFLDFKDRLRFYQHLQAQMHIARVSCHCDRLRIHFFTQRRLWILSLISFCVIPVQWISSLPVWIETKKLSLNIQVNRPPHYVTYGDVIYYLCMWFDYVTKLVLELFPERAQWLRGVLLSSWGCQTTSRHLRNSLHLAMKYLPQVSLSIKPKAGIFYISICMLTKNTFNAQYVRISNLLNSLSKQRGGSISDFNTNCRQLYLLLAS